MSGRSRARGEGNRVHESFNLFVGDVDLGHLREVQIEVLLINGGSADADSEVDTHKSFSVLVVGLNLDSIRAGRGDGGDVEVANELDGTSGSRARHKVAHVSGQGLEGESTERDGDGVRSTRDGLIRGTGESNGSGLSGNRGIGGSIDGLDIDVSGRSGARSEGNRVHESLEVLLFNFGDRKLREVKLISGSIDVDGEINAHKGLSVLVVGLNLDSIRAGRGDGGDVEVANELDGTSGSRARHKVAHVSGQGLEGESTERDGDGVRSTRDGLIRGTGESNGSSLSGDRRVRGGINGLHVNVRAGARARGEGNRVGVSQGENRHKNNEGKNLHYVQRVREDFQR